MKKILPFFKKALYFLERLSSKPKVGGVQVSDSGIQYVFFEGANPISLFFRFPPGVINNGRVVDRKQFLEILKKLHKGVEPESENKISQIVVSLSPAVVYTQSFQVPNVDIERLEESADLNLQMISPMSADSAYMSWQKIGEDLEKYELLGAFVEKKIIDEYRDIFAEAHFHVVVFEFPSLSLSHLFEKKMETSDQPSLVVQVSSDGLDLSIFKKKSVYFSYFRSWKSIQGENKQISRELFDKVISEESQKVANFSSGRFKEGFEKIYIIAPGFEEEVKKAMEEKFNAPIVFVLFPEKRLSPFWYVSWGASIRGGAGIGKEQRINLNSETSSNIFFQEHLLGFIRLWRNILILVFSFFLVVFGVAAYLLQQYHSELEGRLSLSKTKVDEQQFKLLYEEAKEFNAFVVSVGEEPRNVSFWSGFLSDFLSVAKNEKVTVLRIDFTSEDAPVRVSAKAPNAGAAVAFKNILIEKGFKNIDLPLSSISDSGDNFVSFSMTFQVGKNR